MVQVIGFVHVMCRGRQSHSTECVFISNVWMYKDTKIVSVILGLPALGRSLCMYVGWGGGTNGQDTPTTWVHKKRVKTLYGCAEMSIRYFSFLRLFFKRTLPHISSKI